MVWQISTEEATDEVEVEKMEEVEEGGGGAR